MRKRVLTLVMVVALAVFLSAPAALAHGGVDDGHDEQAWLKIALVSGGLVVFGSGAFVALKRR